MTKPWFRGLASIRGTLATRVVDFAAFQGVGADAAQRRCAARPRQQPLRLLQRACWSVARSGCATWINSKPQPEQLDPRPWVGEHFARQPGPRLEEAADS
ncbi:MAG: hypothetical protein MZW92_63850 [Comamonadaceae bacterium]|nr:hypothetical protein [Comamonadaceae bacterium]